MIAITPSASQCTCALCTGAGHTPFRSRANPVRRIETTREDWLHAEIGELDD